MRNWNGVGFVSIVKIFVILLAAIRIGFYIRLFDICIGKCRISKKIVVSAFIILWVFESFVMSLSYIGPGITGMELFFFIVEIPFLSVMSFCYRGRMGERFLMAVFLPFVYWFGKWGIGFLFFKTIQNSYEYVFVTVISVILFCVFGMILERAGKSKQERERELLEEEIRMYENQFQVIRQTQDNIRSLKHDMKHHIKMLSDMTAQGKKEEALAYLSSMGTFMENSEEYVVSGNENVDSILNYMIAKAKSVGVNVSWDIQIPEKLELDVFDINVILSNLCENALHALENMIEPSFYIMMKYDRGVLCISTQNNYSEKGIVSDFARGQGLGLKNIQRVAEKYHGSLEIKRQDGIFYATVLLLT